MGSLTIAGEIKILGKIRFFSGQLSIRKQFFNVHDKLNAQPVNGLFDCDWN